MANKQYKNVVEMMREVNGERPFADALQAYLAQRSLMTELVALRAARGLTQQAIAEKLSCTQGRISKLESATNGELSLGELVRYADVLGFDIGVTLSGKDVTLADRVKHHAFCIKMLTDQLANLASGDKTIAKGVGEFLREAAFNLVRLVASSAKHLPSFPAEYRAPLAIDVYGKQDMEPEDAELAGNEMTCV